MNYILLSVLFGRYINYLVWCFYLLIPFSHWFDFRLFQRAQSLRPNFFFKFRDTLLQSSC